MLFLSLAKGFGLFNRSVSVVVVELVISSILFLMSLAVAILVGSGEVLTIMCGTICRESGI